MLYSDVPSDISSFQLDADSAKQELDDLYDQLDKSMNLVEPYRHQIREQLNPRIKALESKLADYQALGIRPRLTNKE